MMNQKMIRQMRTHCIRLLLATEIVFASPAHAETFDLLSAYKRAVGYDARLRAAQADNQINQEEIGKARAQFRPIVRSSAGRGRNATQHGFHGYISTPESYNTLNFGITVRQSILNLSNLAEYKQAKAAAAKSDADLRKETVNLIVRITEAYCNTLYAEDNQEFSQAHIKATREQLQQAKKRFENGLGTITEVKESQANHDMAIAEGLDISSNVAYTRGELEELIGVYPEQLCRLAPEKMTLQPLAPASVDTWIDMALSANPSLTAAKEEIRIAEHDVQKQRAGRYPTIELVAGRNYSESENNYSIGSTYDTYSIGLQLSVPIYSGGYVSAAVRQAQARLLKAGELRSSQERGVVSDVRKYFNSTTTGIAQINAYDQAMKSQEIALTGTRKGFDAGLRSNVDVLDAEQKLLASRRNLAKSRYQYILNNLMLKQSAGTLSETEIEEINGWFSPAHQRL